jgi:hypothetical protein
LLRSWTPLASACGRTIILAGVLHGPGEALSDLDPAERQHLIATGFLVSAPSVLEPSAIEAAAKNPANIGLQTQQVKYQGPVYTPAAATPGIQSTRR